MRIKPLRRDLLAKITRYHLTKKFAKQKEIFEENPIHPSLNTEKLRPHKLNLYSFRIDRKWRAIFIVTESHDAEIIAISPHYE